MGNVLKALLVCLAIAVAMPAAACTITYTPLKYSFKWAPVVFEGTITQIDSDGAAHFEVHRQWKGSPRETIVVPNQSSGCGYHLVVGERYVVVPNPDGSMGGLRIDRAEASGMIRLLDERSGWWKCPLSSITPYALRHAIQRLRYRI